MTLRDLCDVCPRNIDICIVDKIETPITGRGNVLDIADGYKELMDLTVLAIEPCFDWSWEESYLEIELDVLERGE